ncbi:MAG: hypothetical protein FWD72_05805, partial [Eggerthellaceae bacterium]|nr:hypothetical protein [Eggerthellaceae bacterium]
FKNSGDPDPAASAARLLEGPQKALADNLAPSQPKGAQGVPASNRTARLIEGPFEAPAARSLGWTLSA